MTTAIKHYWKNVKKANDIINPGSTKVPMQVRHFYGELPSDWTANIDHLLSNPPLVTRAWEAFNSGELRTLAGRYQELAENPEGVPFRSNGHAPKAANFETLLEIEGRLDDLIDITRTVDPALTDTLLNARRQIGARLIS